MISTKASRQKLICAMLLLFLVAGVTEVLLPLMDQRETLNHRIIGAEQQLNRLLKLEKKFTESKSFAATSTSEDTNNLIKQLNEAAKRFGIQQVMTKTPQLTGAAHQTITLEFNRVSLAMFMDFLLAQEQARLVVTKFSLIPRGGGLVDISMTTSP